MKKIGIIGGGIVGLSTAYYLSKKGYEVTVVDQGSLTDGCSFGNAGMIVPSHIIPLAAPGMISKGIRWMFDSTSPFYVRPRLNGQLISWGYHFYKSATHSNVARAIPALKEISLLSKSMYQHLKTELPFDFQYQERGLMMLYKTDAAGKEESETAHLANENGIEARILTASQVQEMEPDVRLDVKGGIYFPGDAHLTPRVLVTGLLSYLKDNGVKFLTETTVRNFGMENNRLKTLNTTHGPLAFDEVVLAGGSWSGMIAAHMGLALPMQAGKGYSFTIPDVKANIRIPSIFLEARVAVTPMGNSLRFGGTMEITGVDHSISMNRVKGIVDAIPRYYPDMKLPMPDEKSVWHGLRPCSPDGMPYIGRLTKIENVVVATGHSMMGLSLGPGTGKLVEEIISGGMLSMSLKAFDPERFS